MSTNEKNSITSVIFSPAFSLAVLGTAAFIFSFFRAGELSSLVVPKDYHKPPQPPIQQATPPGELTIDTKSSGLITAIDTSLPTKLALSGNYRQAIDEAIKNLTDNPPTNVANIALAGDILSAIGEKDERDLGYALLFKALSLVPENQFLASRYVQRLLAAHQYGLAIQNLNTFIKQHPNLSGFRLLLAKVYWVANKPTEAIKELEPIKEGHGLTAQELEEEGLLLVKAGKIYDGYKLFRQSMSGKQDGCFYSAYCRDLTDKSNESLKTALAVVEANLNNGPNSNLLSLEIKKATMLMLLDRAKEAKAGLDQAVGKYKNNFDLQVLSAAANFASSNPDQALSDLEIAAKLYQPKP